MFLFANFLGIKLFIGAKTKYLTTVSSVLNSTSETINYTLGIFT